MSAIKLNNNQQLSEKDISDFYNECIKDIIYCSKCEPINQCYDCFKKDNAKIIALDITAEQMFSLWKVYRHIFNDTKLKYGLYGSSGTGKTTLIKYILNINNIANKIARRRTPKCCKILNRTLSPIF